MTTNVDVWLRVDAWLRVDLWLRVELWLRAVVWQASSWWSLSNRPVYYRRCNIFQNMDYCIQHSQYVINRKIMPMRTNSNPMHSGSCLINVMIEIAQWWSAGHVIIHENPGVMQSWWARVVRIITLILALSRKTSYTTRWRRWYWLACSAPC